MLLTVTKAYVRLAVLVNDCWLDLKLYCLHWLSFLCKFFLMRLKNGHNSVKHKKLNSCKIEMVFGKCVIEEVLQPHPLMCELTSVDWLSRDKLWVMAEAHFFMARGFFNLSPNLTQFPIRWSAFFLQINGTKLKHQFLADKIFLPFQQRLEGICSSSSSLTSSFFFLTIAEYIHTAPRISSSISLKAL